MAQWVSFKTIKDQVSIEQVLEHYGLLQEAKRKGDELRLHCPFHEDHQPSLTASIKKNGFHCFGCEAKGNVFAFVRLKEGIDSGNTNNDDRQAALLIAEWFGIASSKPEDTQTRTGKGRARRKPAQKKTEEVSRAVREDVHDATAQAEEEKPVLVSPPLDWKLENLDIEHPYLRKRGLRPETIATFGVGFFGRRGVMAGRVVIPIHNEHGELVAYAGRWPADEGWPEGDDKYKLPPGFHKSLVLFNLHRAREHASEGLIVVEGFFDCMDLWQRGRKNVVALMGCVMSEAQERLIVETVGPRGKVLLALDPDEAGRKGSADAVARLVSQLFVREVVLPVRGS